VGDLFLFDRRFPGNYSGFPVFQSTKALVHRTSNKYRDLRERWTAAHGLIYAGLRPSGTWEV